MIFLEHEFHLRIYHADGVFFLEHESRESHEWEHRECIFANIRVIREIRVQTK